MTIKREKDDGSTTLKLGVVESWVAKTAAAFTVGALAFLCYKIVDQGERIARIEGALGVRESAHGGGD